MEIEQGRLWGCLQISSALKFKEPKSLQIEGDVAFSELPEEGLERHQSGWKLHIPNRVTPSVVMDRNVQQT